MQSIQFPWSDNWWIEECRAWFCGREIGALFCVDMDSGQCDFVARIPECDIKCFRKSSYCIKDHNIIFCLPNNAQSIWYYDIEKATWGKIEINKEKPTIMCVAAYEKRHSQIRLLEDETGRVFRIDLHKKVAEIDGRISCDEIIAVGEYILADDTLYCASGHTVYCIENGNVRTYEISDAKTDLYTICYDGTNFWLSGYCKEIYVWNPKRGMIKIITEFPKSFGFYHFHKDGNPYLDCDSFFSKEFAFFIHSLSLGRYMWYIPFQANGIVYVDKENYEVNFLEIEEERETKESIENNYAGHKYLLQYVRENRYIGLYSFKNRYIFEIDTIELCVQKKNYQLSNEAVSKITKAIDDYNFQRNLEEAMREYNHRKILREGKEWERILYSKLIEDGKEKDVNEFFNIGELIYSTLD